MASVCRQPGVMHAVAVFTTASAAFSLLLIWGFCFVLFCFVFVMLVIPFSRPKKILMLLLDT